MVAAVWTTEPDDHGRCRAHLFPHGTSIIKACPVIDPPGPGLSPLPVTVVRAQRSTKNSWCFPFWDRQETQLLFQLHPLRLRTWGSVSSPVAESLFLVMARMVTRSAGPPAHLTHNKTWRSKHIPITDPSNTDKHCMFIHIIYFFFSLNQMMWVKK